MAKLLKVYQPVSDVGCPTECTTDHGLTRFGKVRARGLGAARDVLHGVSITYRSTTPSVVHGVVQAARDWCTESVLYGAVQRSHVLTF